MGIKQNPGVYDCYAHAEPDEPVFVLLARDPAAPGAIEDWADLRAKMIRHGQKPASDWPMISEARICADQMREWRRLNRPLGSRPTASKGAHILSMREFTEKVRAVIRLVLSNTSSLTDADLDASIEAYMLAPNPASRISVAFAIVTALCGDHIPDAGKMIGAQADG